MKNIKCSSSRQRGIVLIVGIVMLVMMTLVALTLIRLGTRHTQVVNNEQVRTEAEAAANYALDLMLNNSASTWTPYKGAGKVESINIGLSSTSATAADAIGVTLSNLTCRRIRVMENSEFIRSKTGFNYISDSDASCFGSSGNQVTIVDSSAPGSGGGDSLCAEVLFEIRARTNAPQLLDANVELTQGVQVRRSVVDMGTCD